jgi:hypothetical protein
MTVPVGRRAAKDGPHALAAGSSAGGAAGLSAAAMPPAGASLATGGAWTWFATPSRRLLFVGIGLQLALGLLLGHANDSRIFMMTGYLVATGHDPYLSQNLRPVFHHVLFNMGHTVGYPPPWPLVLGLLYRSTYALVPNFLVYGLAIKLPVIAAAVALAYLVAAILQNLGASPAQCRAAWVFLLLNPLVLYFGAAWGQIDVIVALLALAALVLLFAQRWMASAVLLALAVCFKPIALALLAAAVVFIAGRSLARALRYAVVFAAAAFVFYVVPFWVFGWSFHLALHKWNTVFTMSGTMSYMAVLRLVRDPFPLPGHWWLLGLAWVPALAAVTILALRRCDTSFEGLIKLSVAFTLVFFLTRTWLSEPNIVFVVPLALLLTLRSMLDRRALAAIWLLPLVFTLFGWTELQLLWQAFPTALARTASLATRWHSVSLVARAALAVAWQVVGWWIVVSCLRRERTVAL